MRENVLCKITVQSIAQSVITLQFFSSYYHCHDDNVITKKGL